MVELNYGRGIGLQFTDVSDYYYCLGYLSNSGHGISVYTHNNDEDGAWAGQGKLHNHTSISNHPQSFQNSFNQSGDNRLSVTPYVTNLVNNHNFTKCNDPTGKKFTFYRFPESMEHVLKTVPMEYKDDFLRGYHK